MFRKLGEIEFPLNQQVEFGRSTPLFLEIGFGNGSFIENHATENPETNCLGAELSLSSLNRAYKRIRRTELTNVRLYRCDGQFILRYLIPPRTAERIAVNFPDPWPRRKHTSRRLLSSDFFRLAATRLSDKGNVCLATDDLAYFSFAREQAERTGLFSETVLDPPAACLTTRYATKWLERNRSIHYVEFGLINEVPPANESDNVIQRGTMHHAFLTGTLPKLDIPQKSVTRTPTSEIVILDVLHTEEADRYVFVMMVQQDALRQDILIEVKPHKEGYHVGLMRFGSPILMSGISEAVELIATQLESSGMKIEDTWY